MKDGSDKIENMDKVDHLDLNNYLLTSDAGMFLIRAKGDSMTGAGIKNGDMLLVDRKSRPVNNMVVVASLNNKLAVKRLVNSGCRQYLMPANSRYGCIPVNEKDKFEIWGVVKQVIKNTKN